MPVTAVTAAGIVVAAVAVAAVAVMLVACTNECVRYRVPACVRVLSARAAR